ncbi:MAG: preprotein translocase subunit SecG [Akkermansiaceae bacterium]|nr:preprotein translocase subunit SecG [Armatimonadota bacterium]
MQIFITIFTGIVVLISAILIVLVMLQTPRNEGFSGGAASVSGGNFRGKAGMDEILSNYTRTVAFGWFASAFILAVLNEVANR